MQECHTNGKISYRPIIPDLLNKEIQLLREAQILLKKRSVFYVIFLLGIVIPRLFVYNM